MITTSEIKISVLVERAVAAQRWCVVHRVFHLDQPPPARSCAARTVPPPR
ncbi:MAG: hypothetical protein U0935_03410 [Pirellulales bacterium]